jgi:predicted small secreted protein
MMRVAIARALLGLLLVTSIGTALSACRHTVEGAKEDIHRDTR